MDKIIQALNACNSWFGLSALALICITVIIILLIIKPIILKIIDKNDYFHANIHGTSIQAEIDMHGEAA